MTIKISLLDMMRNLRNGDSGASLVQTFSTHTDFDPTKEPEVQTVVDPNGFRHPTYVAAGPKRKEP